MRELPLLGAVADACSLPTTHQPLRVAEFEQLFASALRSVSRTSPVELRFELVESALATARDLCERATACCSFFDFRFGQTTDGIVLDARVPPGREKVLDALQALGKGALRT